MEKTNTRGITIAGSIIVDIVNVIDVYPQKTMLSVIRKSSKAVGGCVPNTIIDLAKIDGNIPLTAAGLIGNDDNGDFILSELEKHGIDTSLIDKTEDYVTSRDYVMNEETSGSRTFFYEPGANAAYTADDLPERLQCDMFHAGYILLLEELDKEDAVYGTKMAKLLFEVQKHGIKTSVDVVSAEGGEFAKKVIPALRYCDYAFMNEVECCAVTGVSPRNGDGSLNVGNIKRTMSELFGYGVKEKVIVHAAEGGFMLNADGSFISSGSLILPDGWIAGSVGAGDAYTAACLYGLYNGYDDTEILEFASAAAACNLSAVDSIGGMRSRDEIKRITARFAKRNI